MCTDESPPPLSAQSGPAASGATTATSDTTPVGGAIPPNPLVAPGEGASAHEAGAAESQRTIQLSVRTISAEVFPITIAEDATVLALKQEVQRVNGTAIELQRLVMAGKVLLTVFREGG